MTSLLGSTLTEQQLPHQQAPISSPPLSPPCSSSSSQQQQQQLGNVAVNGTDKCSGRKRRRANLSRIAIGKLSGSNESLNSNSSGGAGASSAGDYSSEEEAGGSYPTHPLSPTDEPPDAKHWGEQSQSSSNKRFCPSSKAPQESGPENCEEESLAVVECLQNNNGGGSTSGAKTASSQAVASGGLKIGDYEIVGDGRECKAVDIQSKTIFHCLIMKPAEYKTFLSVLERLKSAEAVCTDEEEFHELKCLLVPEETKSMLGKNGCWYVILPDHQGNLHSLVSPVSSDKPSSGKIFSERRVQPIFKQIVALVDFCHRIGIYFRDFRLRKFVFTDKERTRIRVNNILDLWVAPQLDNDQICQRFKSQVCPVYVAPEILMAGVYGGQPADVWALGILMFSLLTGRFPFHDPNPTALFKRIKSRRFSCPVSDGISHNARWLLHSLLRANPSERPTASEVLHSHWLQLEPKALPDGKEASTLPIKSGLSMNSHSVFSSSSSSSSSASLSLISNNQLTSITDGPQGSAPAFVRPISAPVTNGGSGNSHAGQLQVDRTSGLGVGAVTSALQQQSTLLPASLSSSIPPTSAIHVRLALVSARQQPSSLLLHREAPNSPFCNSSLDEMVDQMVPELKEQPSVPSDLTTTLSDHYYSRGPATNTAGTVLSLQSFPPTGMAASSVVLPPAQGRVMMQPAAS